MDMKRHMVIYVFIFIQVGQLGFEPLKREVGAKEQKQTNIICFIIYRYQKVFMLCSHG
jgi:hypothetical protein